MNHSCYSLSKKDSENGLLKKETKDVLPTTDQLKKLTLSQKDDLDENDLRNLIYITDSEGENDETDSPKNSKIDLVLQNSDDKMQISNQNSESNLKKENNSSLEKNDEETVSKCINPNEKLKEIQKESKMLEKKLLGPKNQKKIVDPCLTKISSSAAINRRKAQWNIDRTNQILYKKIQAAKPSGLSVRKGVTLGRNTKLTA